MILLLLPGFPSCSLLLTVLQKSKALEILWSKKDHSSPTFWSRAAVSRRFSRTGEPAGTCGRADGGLSRRFAEKTPKGKTRKSDQKPVCLTEIFHEAGGKSFQDKNIVIDIEMKSGRKWSAQAVLRRRAELASRLAECSISPWLTVSRVAKIQTQPEDHLQKLKEPPS